MAVAVATTGALKTTEVLDFGLFLFCTLAAPEEEKRFAQSKEKLPRRMKGKQLAKSLIESL